MLPGAIAASVNATEAVLDGEIVVFDEGRPSFEALQRHQSQVVFQAFDVLSINGHDVIGLPYTVDVANDPFFGRVGTMMASQQRADTRHVQALLRFGNRAADDGVFDHARGFGHVRALRRSKERRWALALLVAVKRVRPEAPGDRDLRACELARAERDLVVPSRQMLRKRADHHGVGFVTHAEQHALDRSIGGRHDQLPPILCLEVICGRQPPQRATP